MTVTEVLQNTYMRVLRSCEHGPSRVNARGSIAHDCYSTTRPEGVCLAETSNASNVTIRRAYPEKLYVSRVLETLKHNNLSERRVCRYLGCRGKRARYANRVFLYNFTLSQDCRARVSRRTVLCKLCKKYILKIASELRNICPAKKCTKIKVTFELNRKLQSCNTQRYKKNTRSFTHSSNVQFAEVRKFKLLLILSYFLYF